jgi:hypothetical protein
VREFRPAPLLDFHGPRRPTPFSHKRTAVLWALIVTENCPSVASARHVIKRTPARYPPFTAITPEALRK